MRCLGYVLLGISAVALLLVTVFGVVGVFIALAFYTNSMFGFADQYGLCFFVGYMALAAGIAVGVSLCRDNA